MWEELGQGKNSINILCMKKISQNKTKKEGRKERERLRETETQRERALSVPEEKAQWIKHFPHECEPESEFLTLSKT